MPTPGDWIVLADVKTALNVTGSTDDAELQQYVNAAGAILENHPGYTVGDHVRQAPHVEWHDGGRDTIILNHYPVDPTTVTVAEYTGGTSQAIAYQPEDGGSFTGYGWATADGSGDNGIIVRTSGGFRQAWCGRVKVTYTAGVTTVPADLVLAAAVLVEHLWETQRGDGAGGLPTGLDPDLDPASLGAQFGPSFILPNRVRELLTPYQRTPAVA